MMMMMNEKHYILGAPTNWSRFLAGACPGESAAVLRPVSSIKKWIYSRSSSNNSWPSAEQRQIPDPIEDVFAQAYAAW